MFVIKSSIAIGLTCQQFSVHPDEGDVSDDDDVSEIGDSDDEENEEESGDDTDGFDAEEEEPEEAESLKRKFEDEVEEPSAKAAKLDPKDKSLFKIPTVDELNRLRETQTLYHSNLFRLQMEELLSEASMKTKHRFKFNEWLTQFTSYVKSLPASPAYGLSDTKWMKDKNVTSPLSLPEGKGSFQFMAPTEVKFIGSLASETIVTTDEAVDVMLVLPQEIVKYKDFKEAKWLIKRSKYLAWLASHLREQSELVTSVHWTTHLGNKSRPLLQVTPSGSIGKKWKVNLFPVPDSASMKISCFSPEKWTVTPSWYFNREAKEDEVLKETPHCNTSCAMDLVMQNHLELIETNINQNSNLAQGIKLIKIWLAQRGFCKGPRQISGHVIAMLVIHLVQTRKINVQMSGYQVFRTVILTLESAEWNTKGIYMRNNLLEDALPLDKLHELYQVVFMDPSGIVNLLGNLMLEDFLLVKHEAQLAMQLLSSSSVDSFENLFMKKIEFFQYCDQVMNLCLKIKDLKRIIKQHSKVKYEILDHLGDLRYSAWSYIMRMLKKALGDRVQFLVPKSDPVSPWGIEEAPPASKSSLVVGFIINEVAAKALLTKGPPADDPESAYFREFWGEKSNLRRFQDGSFNEAVLWADIKQPVADRRLILGTIVRYILNYHYDLEEKNIRYICGQTESALRLNHCSMYFSYGTGEEATTMAIQGFDSFARKLRMLDLPLKITSVQPTSDVQRHARVFPPIAKALPSEKESTALSTARKEFLPESMDKKDVPTFNYAMDVNVFLETSGKWPDDLLAIQAIKAEFYRTMATMLSEDGITALAFPKFLQVLWNGFFFNVKVCYRREIYLQRLVKNPDGLLREEDTNVARSLEVDLEIIPKITTALASVNADHPCFNCGVRLAKRWMGSQLLLPHIPPIVVELLVAHLCISPAPYDTPNTPHVLFLRFLALLAQTDWKTTPIFINLRDSFQVDDLAELNRKFTSERESLPLMFVATPYELRVQSSLMDADYRYKLASFWTKDSPSVPVIFRCKQLASASLDLVTSNLLKASFDIKMIFRPSMDDFDVLIKLKVSELSRRREHIDSKLKNPVNIKRYNQKRNELMPIIMYDAAALYLKELKAAYGHLALFFYDEHGGREIGVVWKPPELQEQDFKVTNIQGHRIYGIKNVKQIPNLEVILGDFEIIGAGLVESVCVNNKM